MGTITGELPRITSVALPPVPGSDTWDLYGLADPHSNGMWSETATLCRSSSNILGPALRAVRRRRPAVGYAQVPRACRCIAITMLRFRRQVGGYTRVPHGGRYMGVPNDSNAEQSQTIVNAQPHGHVPPTTPLQAHIDSQASPNFSLDAKLHESK